MLSPVQQRVLDSMREDGIALVPFQELFGDEAMWDELAATSATFTEHTEANLEELQAQQKKKSYLIRRFLKSGRPFALDDPWLRFGLSNRMLDIVNAYRGEHTLLIDVDNWYTIPDPNAEDRIASQRWHRDPWDNHIVKVFTYFSDVDEDAGPFEYLRGTPEGGRNAHLWPWEGDDVYDKHGLYPPQDEFEAKAPAGGRPHLHRPARDDGLRRHERLPSRRLDAREAADPLLLLVRLDEVPAGAALRGRLVGRQRALARGRVRRFLVALVARSESLRGSAARAARSAGRAPCSGPRASRSRSSSRAARAG